MRFVGKENEKAHLGGRLHERLIRCSARLSEIHVGKVRGTRYNRLDRQEVVKVVWLILGIVILVVFWIVLTYNSLVRYRKRVQNAWAQIDVQLKRRSDLIPNLVNSVKGYMKFERDTLEKIMEARAKAVSGANVEDRMKAEGEISGLLGRLFALVENYPELKANQNVSNLMEELRNTEDKIAYSRQFYNDITMRYNTKLEVFPSNLIARMFGFKPYPFFEAPEADRERVEVNLDIE